MVKIFLLFFVLFVTCKAIAVKSQLKQEVEKKKRNREKRSIENCNRKNLFIVVCGLGKNEMKFTEAKKKREQKTKFVCEYFI